MVAFLTCNYAALYLTFDVPFDYRLLSLLTLNATRQKIIVIK